MLIVRPRVSVGETGVAEAVDRFCDGLQLEKVVDDFTLTFRQREIAARAWKAEQERFDQTLTAVTETLDHGVGHWLGEAALLLDPHNRRLFGAGGDAAQAGQLRLFVLRTLLANQALLFWLQGRRECPQEDAPELLPVVKQVVAFLRPYFLAAGSDLGIVESCPGLRVAGSGEALRHILLNLFVDLLCQAPAVPHFAVAMTRQDSQATLRVAHGLPSGLAAGTRWHLDARSPGLRLAADIARDQNMVCGFGGASGTLTQIEMAVWADAGTG